MDFTHISNLYIPILSKKCYWVANNSHMFRLYPTITVRYSVPLGVFLVYWIHIRGFYWSLLVSPEIRCAFDSVARNGHRLFVPFHRKPGVCPREHGTATRVPVTRESPLVRSQRLSAVPIRDTRLVLKLYSWATGSSNSSRLLSTNRIHRKPGVFVRWWRR